MPETEDNVIDFMPRLREKQREETKEWLREQGVMSMTWPSGTPLPDDYPICEPRVPNWLTSLMDPDDDDKPSA